MAQPANILIFGATGLIGQYITAQILANYKSASFKKISIFTSPDSLERKKAQIDKLTGQGVEVKVGNVASEEDVRKAYEGIDTVISCLGRPVIASQIPLLSWADSTPSINRFYPSEYGTDIAYNASSAHEKPHQQKLKVRKFVDEHVKSLEITYLVTGPYVDLILGKPPKGAESAGGFDVAAKRAVLLGDGKGKVSFTSMPDVGSLLVAALRSPGKERVRALRVNSFTASPEEIVREFEKQTESKWMVEYTPFEELKRLEEEAWEKGDATLWTLRRIWTEGGTLYDERDNRLIGEPKMETLEELVGRAIEKQRSAST